MSDTHVFVRPATPLDAAAIGDIHARNMRASLSAASGQALDAAVLARISPSAFVQAWRQAIGSPPEVSPRVFVAIEDGVVVGFAALSGANRPPRTEEANVMEMMALEISAGFQRHGHGSRLLSALVDTARELGAHRLQTWALSEDEARMTFLSSAGFGPAGVSRKIEVGRSTVTEDGWHTAL